MSDDRTRRRHRSGDPDDPVILPAEETRIYEEQSVPPTVPPPPGADADVNVVHREERTRVLPDGTVVQEGYRVEQQSRMRERLPWILIALLLALLIAGFAAWYFTRSETRPVPGVVGLRIDEAVTRLQSDGFKVQIARQSNAKPPDVVFGQNPAANTKVDKGSSVRLLVSNGPSSATVPNAVGLSESEARSRLVKAGFTVTTAQVFSDQPAGTVVAQDPAAGQKVTPGTKVRLNVSKGSGQIAVPSEIGSTLEQAQADLVAKGFKPAVTRVPSDQPIDTVVAQSPSGGKARKGATVRLNVSQGPPATTATTGTTTTTTTTTVPATTGTTTTTSP
ncbi:MAG: eukaryotic-like serine/threonine-protein kinase [Gaiellales bacterium]|jgi:serine/threonine-protein kinase|nr:eukaryotic-like serine/threonine-protein kinase [Gaiellales bacterium]